ncbi:MAG TPA: riboflavin synthase [Lacipirellulaceae bacterium]|nr:riboflavin synthase [Lacipirellulaceae bacterium]
MGRAALAVSSPTGEVSDVFTGLVQTMAKVCSLTAEGPGVRLVLAAPDVAAAARVGDSVAINGCCLTVVAVQGDALAFDAGPETLARTNLGRLQVEDAVNVETSLRLGDPLGGHLVTGHIDGLGRIDQRRDDADWRELWIAAPTPLLRQMASKGSVAVDGVSLTLVDVDNRRFSVALIPHTLAVTTLGVRDVGDEVNLETDVLAKYVERQLADRPAPA